MSPITQRRFVATPERRPASQFVNYPMTTARSMANLGNINHSLTNVEYEKFKRGRTQLNQINNVIIPCRCDLLLRSSTMSLLDKVGFRKRDYQPMG